MEWNVMRRAGVVRWHRPESSMDDLILPYLVSWDGERWMLVIGGVPRSLKEGVPARGWQPVCILLMMLACVLSSVDATPRDLGGSCVCQMNVCRLIPGVFQRGDESTARIGFLRPSMANNNSACVCVSC